MKERACSVCGELSFHQDACELRTGPIVVRGIKRPAVAGVVVSLVVGALVGSLVTAAIVRAAPRSGSEPTPQVQGRSGALQEALVKPSVSPTGGTSGQDVQLGSAPRVERKATPVPSSSPTPSKKRQESVRRPATSVRTGRTGTLSHMRAGYPANYLALPIGPGHRVRLCAAICRVYVSTDAGPNKAMLDAGRIADASVEIFEAVCQCPASRGLYRGATWTLLE